MQRGLSKDRLMRYAFKHIGLKPKFKVHICMYSLDFTREMSYTKQQGKEVMKITIKEIIANASTDRTWDYADFPCKVNLDAKAKYQHALECVAKLTFKGKCTFECTPIEEKFSLHTITIHWNCDDDLLEIEKENISYLREMLLDSLVLNIDDGSEWQLSTVIYGPE